MRVSKTVIILLCSLFVHTSNAQSNWKTYEYNPYDFKINFLQTPVITKDTSAFNDTTLITNYWELDVTDSLHPNSYYSISLVTYPSTFIHSDSNLAVIEGFINSTQNKLLHDVEFTNLSASQSSKNGYLGKIFKWKNNSNNVFFEFHVYLIENKLYQLSVISRSGKNHNTAINQYIDSFEFLNTPKGNFTSSTTSNKRTISLKFPGNPTEQIKTIDTEFGKLHLDIQSLEPKEKDENLVYIAMETKYPKNIIDINNTYELNGFYKESIDGSLHAVNGELISINDIYYDGHLGKEYSCYFSEGKALMVYHLFFIDNNLYNFGVITSSSKTQNKGMKKFFKSFKIKN